MRARTHENGCKRCCSGTQLVISGPAVCCVCWGCAVVDLSTMWKWTWTLSLGSEESECRAG